MHSDLDELNPDQVFDREEGEKGLRISFKSRDEMLSDQLQVEEGEFGSTSS